jgi:hypothetical protein
MSDQLGELEEALGRREIFSESGRRQREGCRKILRDLAKTLREVASANQVGEWKDPASHEGTLDRLRIRAGELLDAEAELRKELGIREQHVSNLIKLASSMTMRQARDIQLRLAVIRRALSSVLEGRGGMRNSIDQHDREIVRFESQLNALIALREETNRAREVLAEVMAMSLPPTKEVHAQLRNLENVVGRVEAANASGDAMTLSHAWDQVLSLKKALSQQSEFEIARSRREIDGWLRHLDLNPRLAALWGDALSSISQAMGDRDFIERWTALKGNIGSAVEIEYWRRVGDMKSDVLSKKKLSSFGIRKEKIPWSAVEKLARLSRLTPMPRAMAELSEETLPKTASPTKRIRAGGAPKADYWSR